MRIRLTRWLAPKMDGIDLSQRSVGDVIDLARDDAEMLISEGWALRADSELRIRDRRGVRSGGVDDTPFARRKRGP